jgi:hypothetical protein
LHEPEVVFKIEFAMHELQLDVKDSQVLHFISLQRMQSPVLTQVSHSESQGLQLSLKKNP